MRGDIKKSFKKLDALTWIMFVVVIVYVLSLLYVLGFGIVNSLKSSMDYRRGNVFGLPRADYGWQFANFATVFKRFRRQINPPGDMPRYVYMPEMFLNSVWYAVIVSVFSIAVQVMVAYAVAKYRFRLRGLIHTVAIVVITVPIVGSLASELQLARFLHITNSALGVALMQCKYPGIYYLVFYAMFKNVSWTFAEAAQIDGAGHLTIFFRIMLPMVMSTVIAVFILQFIANWNNYTTPMIFTPLKPTMAYGLFTFQTNQDTGVSTPLKLAAGILTCIPVVILFLVFRNKIMSNITMGGIKG